MRVIEVVIDVCEALGLLSAKLLTFLAGLQIVRCADSYLRMVNNRR